ncbi:HAMP domain-containing sensor histidine kinase [Gorillibacterium sp. CAU 1737]|uniref:HAMP domain-containing sensor histidine kinase n=1 Tax=Gorillibacterium sp. CAU 1737 TaxID=3140362 RepID=UPI00326164D6
MKIKKGAIGAIVLLFLGIGVILYAFRGTEEAGMDLVAVNDITQSLIKQWDHLDPGQLPGGQYGLDYVVLDSGEQFLAATRKGLNEDMDSAIRNRDTMVDITLDGKVLGKLILFNHTRELWGQYRSDFLLFLGVSLISITMFCLLYALYIDRSIFRPFRNLQAFARHVAEGKLDMPLEMDKGNGFGAFAESFDLMREELAKARESERMANQSKKELVASLSHDIKTPIASIKAVSEVMMIHAVEEDKNQLAVINSKADQINSLVTNLFTATLEELQQLTVTVTEESSAVVAHVIQQVDYQNKAVIARIPECVVRIDRLRFLQVVDNVISNSYKYAGTPITVSACIIGPYLELAFEDQGQGVSSDELPLLFHKYYRAQNAAGKSGTGLGLHISHYLMSKMAGEIDCRNVEGGFVVTVRLLLA